MSVTAPSGKRKCLKGDSCARWEVVGMDISPCHLQSQHYRKGLRLAGGLFGFAAFLKLGRGEGQGEVRCGFPGLPLEEGQAINQINKLHWDPKKPGPFIALLDF